MMIPPLCWVPPNVSVAIAVSDCRPSNVRHVRNANALTPDSQNVPEGIRLAGKREEALLEDGIAQKSPGSLVDTSRIRQPHRHLEPPQCL